jgi:hypothetical protein
MHAPSISFLRDVPGMKISRIFIGIRGLCYAVEVQLKDIVAYIPIEYAYVHKTSAEEIARHSISYGYTAQKNMRAISHINDFIKRTRALTYTYDFDAIIRVDNASIGILYHVGRGQRMIAYFDRDDRSAEERASMIAIRDFSVDPRVLLNATADSFARAKVAIANRAESAIFPYYEYELFCMQFMARIGEHLRNTKARAQISRIIRESGRNTDKLRAALSQMHLTRHDIESILAHSIEASHSLDIDLDELYERIDGPRDIFETWIRALMEPVTTHTSTNPPLTAMIAPCAPTSTSAYCDGAKLRIKTELATLVNIFASDLRNPMKRAYIFARGFTPESRTQFADFARHPSELIVISSDEGSRV